MISRYSIYGGGGGANRTINEASGSDGFFSRLTNPVVLGVAAIAGYFVFMD